MRYFVKTTVKEEKNIPRDDGVPCKEITFLFTEGAYVEEVGRTDKGLIIVRHLDGEKDGVRGVFKEDELEKFEGSTHCVTPQCCERARLSGAIYIGVDGGGIEEQNPTWLVRTWHPKYEQVSSEPAEFCPFCGTKLPEIVRSNLKRKICKVTDGGYYCDSCKERLNQCICLPPSFNWKAKG